MTELLIHYKDGEGKITDRRISEIEPQEPGYIVAFCHERREVRTFKVSRIVSAVDSETGDVIEDLHAFLGMEPPAKPQPPKLEPIPVGSEAVKRQRNKEKRELFKPFRLSLVEEHAKKRLFDYFMNACFKCGSPGPLVMDHHVPIALGGHLVPGNLVALCERCNNRKSDDPPEAFYTKVEQDRLRGFLDNQRALFEFSFDDEAWGVDREGYLISLGIEADLVREALKNPDHRFHIPPRDDLEPIRVTITIDAETIDKIVQGALAEKGASEESISE